MIPEVDLEVIRQRVVTEAEWRGGSDEEYHCRTDRRRLLAEVDRLQSILAMARPVLYHVSRGRRAAFITYYPDAQARMALGALTDP